MTATLLIFLLLNIIRMAQLTIKIDPRLLKAVMPRQMIFY